MGHYEHDSIHVREQLVKSLNYSKPKISSVAPASSVLARLGLAQSSRLVSDSIEQLIEALRDPGWETRASAAIALGKTRSYTALGPLIYALRDEHESVRAASARAMGRLGNREATPFLVQILQDHSSLVRGAAATAIGNIGVIFSIEALFDTLHDVEASVRTAAAYTLGQLGDTAALSSLISVVHDPHMLVREAIADALGMLGDPEGRYALLQLLQDEEELVRDAAIGALEKLESDLSRKFVHALTLETEEAVQKEAGTAVMTLIDLGLSVQQEQAIVKMLLAALDGTDKRVQNITWYYLIGRALEIVSERTPMQPLIDMLCFEPHRSGEREIIWHAIFSLTQQISTSHKQIGLLLSALHDPYNIVQIEAEKAVDALVELASTLLEDRSSTGRLTVALENSADKPKEATQRSLLRIALEALDEREPLEELFKQLSKPDAKFRTHALHTLTRRARKAFMGRIPGGPLVLSLRNSPGAEAIELQFGSDSQGERKKDDRRQVFAWRDSASSKQLWKQQFRATTIDSSHLAAYAPYCSWN